MPYVTPNELPEGYERELLVILMEECAEVVMHCSKALRFGLDDGMPQLGDMNRVCIAQELGDLRAVTDKLLKFGTIRQENIDWGYRQKLARLKLFLQHTEPV